MNMDEADVAKTRTLGHFTRL